MRQKIEKAIYSKQQDIDYQKELAERMKSSLPDSSSSSNADAVKVLSKIVDELLEEKLRSLKLPDSNSDFKLEFRSIPDWEPGQEPTVRMKIHHYITVIETTLRKLALDVLKNEPNWKKELIPKDMVVPILRLKFSMQNLSWLCRNLQIRNDEHPEIKQTMAKLNTLRMKLLLKGK